MDVPESVPVEHVCALLLLHHERFHECICGRVVAKRPGDEIVG